MLTDFIPLAVLLQKTSLTPSSSNKRSVKFASTATVISPDETDGMTGQADISSAPLKEADAMPSYPPPPPPDVLAPQPPPITGPYIPAYVANNPLALHLQANANAYANTNTNGFGVGGFSGLPPPPPQTLPPLAPPASFMNGNGSVPGGPSFLPNGGAAVNGAQPPPQSVPLVRPTPPPIASKPTGLRPVPLQVDSSAFAPQPPPKFSERPARQQQQLLPSRER